MTGEAASHTRRPAAFRSRVVIRAPAGTWLTCSVNVRRGQTGSAQYQRRLRHTSSSPCSPNGRSRGWVTAELLTGHQAALMCDHGTWGLGGRAWYSPPDDDPMSPMWDWDGGSA